MRTLLLLLLAACTLSAAAQTKIVGFVKLQSSSNQAMPNAEVWAIGAASKPLRFSNAKGYFELEFPNKKVGDVIREISVTLDGYEVVNKKELESYGLVSQPEDNPLVIVLCKQGNYRKAAADYYQTIYQAGEAELEAEKKRLETLLEREQQNNELLQQQLAEINKKLENLPQVAEAAADYFAKIDLDQATQLQKNALAELERGNIQAALDAMPEAEMDKTLANAQQRKQQLETQLDEANQVIKQSIENYLFKARLYFSTGDYAAAERLYEKAIAADTTNIENIFDYAIFLENINRYDKALRWLEEITDRSADSWVNAQALLMKGKVHEEVGDFINSLSAYRQSNLLFDSLYRQYPERDTIKGNLAASYLALGHLFKKQDDWDGALSLYQRGKDLIEKLYQENPENTWYKTGLSAFYEAIGSCYKAKSKWDEALMQYQESNKLIKEVFSTNPKDKEVINQLGSSYEVLGLIWQQKGERNNALNIFQQMQQMYLNLPDSDIGLRSQRKLGLATSHRFIGGLYFEQENLDSALLFARQYHRLSKELHEEYPLREHYKYMLAAASGQLAEAYWLNDSINEAIYWIQESVNLHKILVKTNPSDINWVKGLAISYQRLGDFYFHLGDLGAAKTCYFEQLRTMKNLCNPNCEEEDSKNGLAIAYDKLGWYYLNLSTPNLDSALFFFQKGEILFEELSNKNPKNRDLKEGLGVLCQRIGLVYANIGNIDAAIQVHIEAKGIFEDLLKADPKHEKIRNHLRYSYEQLGKIFQEQNILDTALIFLLQNLQLTEALYENNRLNKQYLEFLGLCHVSLVSLYERLDSINQAISHYERAAYVWKELYESNGWEGYLDIYNTVQRQLERLKNPDNDLVSRLTKLEQQRDAATDPAERVRYQEEIVQLSQILADNNIENPEFKVNVSYQYYNLARYYLLNRQFDAAEVNAQKGFHLEKDAIFYIVLLPAQLFLGKWEEAEKGYQFWKDVPYEENITFKEVFLADLDALEAAGITHPDVARVRKLLRE